MADMNGEKGVVWAYWLHLENEIPQFVVTKGAELTPEHPLLSYKSKVLPHGVYSLHTDGGVLTKVNLGVTAKDVNPESQYLFGERIELFDHVLKHAKHSAQQKFDDVFVEQSEKIVDIEKTTKELVAKWGDPNAVIAAKSWIVDQDGINLGNRFLGPEALAPLVAWVKSHSPDSVGSSLVELVDALDVDKEALAKAITIAVKKQIEIEMRSAKSDLDSTSVFGSHQSSVDRQLFVDVFSELEFIEKEPQILDIFEANWENLVAAGPGDILPNPPNATGVMFSNGRGDAFKTALQSLTDVPVPQATKPKMFARLRGGSKKAHSTEQAAQDGSKTARSGSQKRFSFRKS